ncbi:minor coat protein [Tetterwort vein chlorosis virus]|uniref:Minor coat protein n=1 Tax=Tetterwort vein chlorosis virus TaxID=1712389 RepID=A0A0M5L077_9CLOS|nr:minor coat protein [Tetterwort vein chlorosis virus]ALE18224.1 minor coat protein [Tetterwort vein chlorosis virus]
MDLEDLFSEDKSELLVRANNDIWSQSVGMNLKNIRRLELRYKYGSGEMETNYILHLKFIIPDGNLIHEFSFNHPGSHKFKQTGGRFWSSAFDELEKCRPNKIGHLGHFSVVEEGDYYYLAVNGWRHVRVKKSHQPTDLIISLVNTDTSGILDPAVQYQSNFVKWNSLFSEITLNNVKSEIKAVTISMTRSNTGKRTDLKPAQGLDFENARRFSDLNVKEVGRDDDNNDNIKPPKPNIPDDNIKPKPKNDSINPPGPKPEGKGDEEGKDVDNSNVKPEPNLVVDPSTIIDVSNSISTRSKLRGVGRYALRYDVLESIMKKMIAYYVTMGFDDIQAKLIIYQFGVSFCTSKNSTADKGSHLLWDTKDGRVLQLKKCDHVRMLNRLSPEPCNVERLLLRSRSKEIFQLLKNGVLKTSLVHCKKRSLKPEWAYLACDFYDLSVLDLSESELLALNSPALYVLLRNKHKRSIVNVNQLH